MRPQAVQELQQEYMFWESARQEAEDNLRQLQAGSYRAYLCLVLEMWP